MLISDSPSVAGDPNVCGAIITINFSSQIAGRFRPTAIAAIASVMPHTGAGGEGSLRYVQRASAMTVITVADADRQKVIAEITIATA